MKIINIMVGGPASEIPDLAQYTSAEISWVGVDRGAKRFVRPWNCTDRCDGRF